MEDYRILICNTQLIWVASDFYPEKDKRILVDTEDECYTTQRSIPKVAKDIINTLNKVKGAGKKPKLMYKPECPSYLEFADGYFGRPKVPSKFWLHSPLNSSQIKELEEIIVSS